MSKMNDLKIKHLDKQWEKFVREHGICESCGKPKDDLSWSHILKRDFKKTRWDVRNLHCMCWIDCHRMFTIEPVKFDLFVPSTTCGKYVDTMLVQAHSIVKPDFDLWISVLDIRKERNLTLEETRIWLGDQIMLSELDLMMLA